MDIQNNQLYSGIQLVNATNKIHTTREGYVSKRDYEMMPELEFVPGQDNNYSNLHPGMYKVNIDGNIYGFLIHDNYTEYDHLVINNPNNIYSLVNFKSYPHYTYKLHSGQIVEEQGHVVNHTINDFFEIFMVDGKTRFIPPQGVLSVYNPGKLDYLDYIRIHITKSDSTSIDHILNIRNYLKSIDTEYPESKYTIGDTLFIDAIRNKALFIFRLGKLTFTGNESFQNTEYSTDENLVLYYPNTICKINGRVQANSLLTIPWEQMIDRDNTSEGICLGVDKSTQGFWIKIKIFALDTFDLFKQYLLDGIAELTVTYEYTNPKYEHHILNNYKIPTFFNKQWLMCIPYKSENQRPLYHDNNPTVKVSEAYSSDEHSSDNILLLEDLDDDILLSADINLRTMYFYKHLRV